MVLGLHAASSTSCHYGLAAFPLSYGCENILPIADKEECDIILISSAADLCYESVWHGGTVSLNN